MAPCTLSPQGRPTRARPAPESRAGGMGLQSKHCGPLPSGPFGGLPLGLVRVSHLCRSREGTLGKEASTAKAWVCHLHGASTHQARCTLRSPQFPFSGPNMLFLPI